MSDTQRLDQWLWHARFFKTRGLATKLVAGGQVRVDGIRISKPSHALRPGATLTFPQARRIRVIRVEVLALDDRALTPYALSVLTSLLAYPPAHAACAKCARARAPGREAPRAR